MKQSLDELLAERNVDTETLHQAVRYYLAERTDDLPIEDMKGELLGATNASSDVEQALADLERHPAALEQGALAILSSAWEDPAERESVVSAIDNARGKLPIIEVGVLGIVVMYGLYLQKTGSLKESETIVERTPDGGFKETTRQKYFGVGSALGAVVKLFSGARTD